MLFVMIFLCSVLTSTPYALALSMSLLDQFFRSSPLLPPMEINGWWSWSVYSMIIYRYMLDRMDESKQPCRIPAVVLKDSLADCSRTLYCWSSRKIIIVSKCPKHLCSRRILTACSVITVGQKAGCTCTQAAAVSSTGVSTRHTG